MSSCLFKQLLKQEHSKITAKVYSYVCGLHEPMLEFSYHDVWYRTKSIKLLQESLLFVLLLRQEDKNKFNCWGGGFDG